METLSNFFTTPSFQLTMVIVVVSVFIGIVLTIHVFPRLFSGSYKARKQSLSLINSFLKLIDKNPDKRSALEIIFQYLEVLIETAENTESFKEQANSEEELNSMKHIYVKSTILGLLDTEGIHVDKNLNTIIDGLISIAVSYKK